MRIPDPKKCSNPEAITGILGGILNPNAELGVHIMYMYMVIIYNPRILTPPMEKPDPPSDTPGASKQVVLTPHDIPRILRVYITIPLPFLEFLKLPFLQRVASLKKSHSPRKKKNTHKVKKKRKNADSAPRYKYWIQSALCGARWFWLPSGEPILIFRPKSLWEFLRGLHKDSHPQGNSRPYQGIMVVHNPLYSKALLIVSTHLWTHTLKPS